MFSSLAEFAVRKNLCDDSVPRPRMLLGHLFVVFVEACELNLASVGVYIFVIAGRGIPT